MLLAVKRRRRVVREEDQPVAFAHEARAFFTPVCEDKWACHKQS